MSPFFFLDVLRAAQLTTDLCPVPPCPKPSDTLTHTHTHSTKGKVGTGATQPKVNQIFFMLLKHFLSMSNIQSSAQKLLEAGRLGNSTASNCSLLQQSLQAWGGEVTCTNRPPPNCHPPPPAREMRVWSQTSHHRHRICSLSLTGPRRPASSKASLLLLLGPLRF